MRRLLFVLSFFTYFSVVPQLALSGPLKANILDSDDRAWFYNRPNVSLDQIIKDQTACVTFGRIMFGSKDPNKGMTYGLVGAVIGK